MAESVKMKCKDAFSPSKYCWPRKIMCCETHDRPLSLHEAETFSPKCHVDVPQTAAVNETISLLYHPQSWTHQT